MHDQSVRSLESKGFFSCLLNSSIILCFDSIKSIGSIALISTSFLNKARIALEWH